MIILPRNEAWALAQGLSVVEGTTAHEDLNTPLVTWTTPPTIRSPQPSRLAQRGDETRMQFFDRVSGNGEHHSHYMKRLTRAELQASGAMLELDWSPTRDAFHPTLNPEG